MHDTKTINHQLQRQSIWSGISVKSKVSFYHDVHLFYVVVYTFIDAAFALSVAHSLIKT